MNIYDLINPKHSVNRARRLLAFGKKRHSKTLDQIADANNALRAGNEHLRTEVEQLERENKDFDRLLDHYQEQIYECQKALGRPGMEDFETASEIRKQLAERDCKLANALEAIRNCVEYDSAEPAREYIHSDTSRESREVGD